MDGEEVEDNGERVVVAHLRVFLGAILGFSLSKQKAQRQIGSPRGLIGTIDERSGDYLLTASEV